MLYLYVKAFHLVFVITWFSGLFYIVRLFIYVAEANEKKSPEKEILQQQLLLMTKRLWLIITWPSAIITLLLGLRLLLVIGWQDWFLWKAIFLVGLYAYHFSLHRIYKQQQRKIFFYTPQQLRLWNEVATIFVFAIVLIAVLKNAWNMLYGLCGLLLLVMVLWIAIRLYQRYRKG